MRSYITLISSLIILTACSLEIKSLSNGHIYTYQEMSSHRGSLRNFVQDLIKKGHLDQAFYALDFYKSLELLAFDPNIEVTAPPRHVAVKSSSSPTDKQRAAVRLQTITSVAINSQEPIGIRAKTFWRQQELIDQRRMIIERKGLSRRLLSDLPTIYSLKEIQSSLNPRDLVISFFIADRSIYLIWIKRNQKGIVELDQNISALFTTTSELLHSLKDTSSERWINYAQQLYTYLFKRIEPQISQSRQLIIIPDGFLANIPYAVLADSNQKLLVDQVAIRYLPSASANLNSINKTLNAHPPRLLIIGNPTFPFELSPLPLAEKESRVLSRIFPDSTYLTGDAATETRLREVLPYHNVLHLATHGLLSNLGSGNSGLIFAPHQTHNGVWSSAEISQTDLKHISLTILSACQTSVSTSMTNSLSGITAAFLTAGSQTVIGSLWQISDHSTAIFMIKFYEKFLELGYLDALRAAQVYLRTQPRYAHPYYWAAFVLYGASS